jgi:hypothetical protein
MKVKSMVCPHCKKSFLYKEAHAGQVVMTYVERV